MTLTKLRLTSVYTSSINRKAFHGKVIIQSPLEAKSHAEALSKRAWDSGFLSVWVDASRESGIGICYRKAASDTHWTGEATCASQLGGTFQAELYAITRGLQVVLQEVKEQPGLAIKEERAEADQGGSSQHSRPIVYIMSDCREALVYIANGKIGRLIKNEPHGKKIPPQLVRRITSYACELFRLGLDVQLCWVPGHSQISGNHMADKLAERGWMEGKHRAMPRKKLRSIKGMRPVQFWHVPKYWMEVPHQRANRMAGRIGARGSWSWELHAKRKDDIIRVATFWSRELLRRVKSNEVQLKAPRSMMGTTPKRARKQEEANRQPVPWPRLRKLLQYLGLARTKSES